jgi:hypothetical protein
MCQQLNVPMKGKVRCTDRTPQRGVPIQSATYMAQARE